MAMTLTAADYQTMLADAAEVLRGRLGKIPSTLVVTGSGLGPFANEVEDALVTPYEELRHFPASTVQGHAGKLVKGALDGRPILVMSGRKHLYEGIDIRLATLPLRALLACGVKTVVLSNAAGGLNRTFDVGDLMLITDHINNQFQNPLIGPNLDDLGPRFPDMSEPYSRELGQIARDVAREQGIILREGVYVANTGPSYETYAEVHMLRQFADAVGMSTVPENLLAVHAGAQVLGISLITNSLVNRTRDTVTHDEVMETAALATQRFCRLVRGVLAKLPA